MHQASAAIDVARKRLEQAKAGAKPSEIAAQRADVDRLQREVENAQTDLERHKSLGSNVTAAELDRLQLRVDSSSRTLMSAQQRLAGLEQVRPVDVAVVESELQQAIRVEARARAEYDASIIHSPIAGRVIKIHAHAGEAVGTDGLLELAPIDPMYAVAEIAESDISRVKPGQKATVTGDGLAAPVQGVVERVGTKVLQNQIMPVDPANFSDARVVEVWVKLESPKAVEDLIHLRVDVVIRP
jgi:HlyD family secretion protein